VLLSFVLGITPAKESHRSTGPLYGDFHIEAAAESIKETISNVEQTSRVPPDNPELQSLKDILMHRLDEVESAEDPEHPPKPDWTRGRRRIGKRAT